LIHKANSTILPTQKRKFLFLSYGGSFAYNQIYAKICRLTKISLGYDVYPHIDKSVCNRAYLTCGYGGFYLARYAKGIEDIFELDKEK